jgi:DNA-binding SARP family transcriptional activator
LAPQELAFVQIHLAGALSIAQGGTLLVEAELGRRQARLAFAYLTLNRTRAIAREELADTLWPSDVPDAWDVALRSLLSKLRAALDRPPLGISLLTSTGIVRLDLPHGVWVDLEAAASALETAEACLRNDHPRDAFSSASLAAVIFRRPLLPGVESPWLDARRDEHARKLRRALVCLATIWLAVDQPAFAIESATEALALDPTAEDACRLLMAAHLATGNPAAALRTYHTLRIALREDLGASPTPETESLFHELLTTS